MNIKFLSIMLLITGISWTFSGLAVKTDDVLASAISAVNQASIHHLEIALELYYLDHYSYPDVIGGPELIKELKRGRYVKQDSSANLGDFDYQTENNGQNYLLKLKQ